MLLKRLFSYNMYECAIICYNSAWCNHRFRVPFFTINRKKLILCLRRIKMIILSLCDRIWHFRSLFEWQSVHGPVSRIKLLYNCNMDSETFPRKCRITTFLLLSDNRKLTYREVGVEFFNLPHLPSYSLTCKCNFVAAAQQHLNHQIT